MKLKQITIPGVLTVKATDKINVSYDAHYNLVEICEGEKVIRSEIAPRNYTVSQFMTTLQRVRNFYQQN